jgi:non-specific serine/threonine protein kinase
LNLEPGVTLSHYVLVERIGEGGMGVVWKALDSTLGRHVALKVLPDDVAADPERLALLQHEARALAALNHPNIVTLHSVEETDGIHFITMEMVEGSTLAQLIPPEGMPPDEIIRYALRITDGLAAAHAGGVIHRDLKPSNIIVGTDGRLRILDFGLAKRGALRAEPGLTDSATETLSTLTQPHRLKGTLRYMSPEQLRGEPTDHRSDLFSLGVVLYEMATGSPPFRGETTLEVISSILREELPPIAESRPGFPEGLERIVAGCLVKDPARRCQSAAEIHDALGQIEVAGAGPVRRTVRRLLVPLLLIVSAAVLAKLFWPARPKVELTTNAVAILPFANLTGDASKDYIADGISAGLIAHLSEVSGLRVAARAATLGRTGAPLSPAALEDNGIGEFLEGEVQQSGQDLRVDVKLIDTHSKLVLWSEGFRGPSTGIFELQKEIADRLTSVVSIPLSSKERDRLGKDPTRSFKAWEYFVKASLKLNERDPKSLDPAVDLLDQALRLDPEFALAHAALSEACWGIYYRDADSEKLHAAEQEARRALEIDPGLPAAQLALARVFRVSGRSAESIEELKKILKNHPHPDEAELQLARNYERLKNLDEAEKSYRAAAAIGPKDWFNWNALGRFLLKVRANYDEARQAFEKANELAPKSVTIPRQNLAATVFTQGHFDEAVTLYESLPQPISRADLASNIGTAYYFSSLPKSVRLDKAEKYNRLAVQLNPKIAVVRRNLADVLVDLDRRPEALEHYREALRLTEEKLSNDPRDVGLRLDQSVYAAKSDRCDEAVAVADALAKEMPQTAANTHDLASAYALCNRKREALDALESSVRLGYAREAIVKEREFEGVSTDPRFKALTTTPGG